MKGIALSMNCSTCFSAGMPDLMSIFLDKSLKNQCTNTVNIENEKHTSG